MGRVPEPDEPYWTRRDRHIAVALVEYRKSLCRCGVPRDIGWDGDNEGRWAGEIRTCVVCAATEKADRAFRNPGPDVEVDDAGAYPVAIERHHE